MRTNEEVRFVIEIEVTDVARFKETVARCVEVSRTEPGTLLYDWYLDEAAGTARLYEAYESLDALRTHAKGPVSTDVGVPLGECSRFIHVDAFGDLGDMTERPTFWPTTFWGAPFASLDEGG